MAKKYLKFRRVLDRVQGNELRDLLADHQIDSDLADISTQFDINNVGGISHTQFEVQIAAENFKKAEQILEENAKKMVLQLDSSHYLYTFSTEELYDVLKKPDEWGATDYLLTKKILQEQGEDVNDVYLKKLREDRIDSLRRPLYDNWLWIGFGYLCAVSVDIVLGVIIGLVIWSAKRTLPNGETAYYYSKSNRNHARVIVPLGMIVFSIYLWFSLSFRGVVTVYVSGFASSFHLF